MNYASHNKKSNLLNEKYKVAGRIVEGRQEMGKNYVSHYKDNQILVQ